MIFFKVLAFIVICFNLYLLTISKKKNKLVILDAREKIQKIHSLVKFKNTEKIRTKYVHDIGKSIQKVRIFAMFHFIITISARIAFAILSMCLIFTLPLFCLHVLSEGISYKLNINRITHPLYKLAKVLEIIMLAVIIYG